MIHSTYLLGLRLWFLLFLPSLAHTMHFTELHQLRLKRTKDRKKYSRRSVFLIGVNKIHDLDQLNKDELTSKLHQAMEKENLKSVQKCIALGADVDIPCTFNKPPYFYKPPYNESINTTPLIFAIANRRCSKTMIRGLISKTHNLEYKGESGCTALAIAAMHRPSKIIKWLLKAGANPNAKTNDSRTPLTLASEYADISTFKQLLQAGADPQPAVHTASTIAQFALLLEFNADINLANEIGETALVNAIEQENPELCKFLIENGAQFEFADYIWETGELEISNLETIKILIQTPIFLPKRTEKEFLFFEENILCAIWSLKKACPRLPRDVIYLILNSSENLRFNFMHCPFKIHQNKYEHIPIMPLQIIRKLVRNGLFDRQKAIEALKINQMAVLKQKLADIYPRLNLSPEIIELFIPDHIEANHGVAIEDHIRKALE